MRKYDLIRTNYDIHLLLSKQINCLLIGTIMSLAFPHHFSQTYLTLFTMGMHGAQLGPYHIYVACELNVVTGEQAGHRRHIRRSFQNVCTRRKCGQCYVLIQSGQWCSNLC